MAKQSNTQQIEKLLGQLRAAKEDKAKRTIRKMLRELGHKGGLNQPRTFKGKKAKAGKAISSFKSKKEAKIAKSKAEVVAAIKARAKHVTTQADYEAGAKAEE